MKKTLLALSTALLMAGGTAGTAIAQDYYESPVIVVQGDPYPDYRYEDRYTAHVRKNGRGRVVADKDCDGVPDRFDHHEPVRYNDRDCDGITNYYDRRDTPRARYATAATRYQTTARYYGPEPYAAFSVGAYMPASYYSGGYYVDYRAYGLNPPPYGYTWVRVGNDAYLVSTRNGLVADVIVSLFL